MSLYARVQALARGGSIGFTPGSFARIGDVRPLLPQGTVVRVGWPTDSITPDRLVTTAAALTDQGMAPFVLVPARRLPDENAARDFIERLVTEAGVTDIQLVAGDREPPIGPFRDSLDVLASGLLDDCGLVRLGVAGHPGGHPLVDAAALRQALRIKRAWSERTGVPLRVRTQVVFDTAGVADWAHRFLWAEAPGTALDIGIPGPVAVSTAHAYAWRIGGAVSADELARAVGGDPAQASGTFDAGAAVLTLARWLAREPDAPVTGLMVNQFGGTERTARWLNALMQGRFSVADSTLAVAS